MKNSIVALVFAATLVSACSNDPKPSSTSAGPAETTETPAPAVAMEPAVVNLNAGDDMKFDAEEIRVKEGQTVKLTLTHTGKAPKASMGHNFVLLAQGAVVQDFAKEAINAKDNDYLPPSMAVDVIAHTRLLGGGESDAIEFTAPAKGTYDFLCSFPGHFGMMKGKFIVE